MPKKVEDSVPGIQPDPDIKKVTKAQLRAAEEKLRKEKDKELDPMDDTEDELEQPEG